VSRWVIITFLGDCIIAKSYLVATPIGNLEDITLRALRVLKEAGLIAAEDTRKTGLLLKKYGINTPLISYYEHSKPARIDYILSRLEQHDVAVVSDAGMPGISDPGFTLVEKAIELGAKVVPIPGPSAVIAALAASGLPADRFCYLGFLPRKKPERQRLLSSLAGYSGSIVVFEAPHRLTGSLNDIMAAFGNRYIVIAREITKIYEEFFRGDISQALEHFKDPRGEFTLVIKGHQAAEQEGISDDMLSRLSGMRQAGWQASKAVKTLAAETGLNRRVIYQAWLQSEFNEHENIKEQDI
jgi:16S rRNA (cytidine1402-2'-O)-methyltransferase